MPSHNLTRILSITSILAVTMASATAEAGFTRTGISPTGRDIVMDFSDPQHGIAGYAWALFNTDDGGATWHASQGSGGSIAISPDGTRAVAGTGGGVVRRSYDGGATWQKIGDWGSHMNGGAYMWDNETFDLRTYAPWDLVHHTTNFGNSHTSTAPSSYGGQWGDGHRRPCDDGTGGVYWPSGTELHYSDDQGVSWSMMEVDDTPLNNHMDIQGCAFIDESNGWAVGWEGGAWRTDDGGGSWTILNTDSTAWLKGVGFYDDSVGWAVGQGEVLETCDGGETWTSIADELGIGNQYVRSVEVFGDGTVYLLGSMGVLSWDGLTQSCAATGADSDFDGVPDDQDVCHGYDDTLDADFDSVPDACDLCAGADSSGDSDEDLSCDDIDNCVVDSNPDQADADADGIGDVCELDSDEDGVIDDFDNCADDFNPDQADSDADASGDVCDPDDDDDAVLDVVDNCPLLANGDQLDFDLDGQGDACDGDDDADGVIDEQDLCPVTALDLLTNIDGCSGAQYVEAVVGSCGDYNKHGHYVRAVTQAANHARAEGLLTGTEKGALVKAAAKSSC